MRHLPVLVNRAAGTASGAAEERITKALAAEGVRAEVQVVPAQELGEEVRSLARRGGTVAVAGGDGTLSAAAGSLAGTGAVLAPFPMGTRNHFCRRLGIDTPEAAARAVALGRVVRVPLGSVRGRTFINHASAGLYPRLVWHRERVRRWTGKVVADVAAGLYVLLRLETTTVLLEIDGAREERSVVGLWVGLGRGAFRLPVDSRAPTGGELEVLVPTTRTRSGVLLRGTRAVWRLWRGLPLGAAGIEVLHAPAFTLEARQPVDLSRDGEVERVHPPLHFRILPRALAVLCLVDPGA